MIRYSRFQNSDGSQNVSVFDPETTEVLVATNEHPNWAAIIEALDSGDEKVYGLFDVSKTVENYFNELSERVSVANGRVYFDGDAVDNAITKQILRFIDEDVDDWLPLVEFWERLQANPSEHSREQLYRWLEAHDFTITYDGKFLAYKGVQVNDKYDDENVHRYQSISRGTAIVDGKEYNGAIPNALGSVVTMPRSSVTFDPADGCNVGLHAGTWKYASEFAQGAVLTVEIDPRDVVSVPVDCESQKLRVCRYVVVDVAEVENTSAFVGSTEEDNSDDDGYNYEDGDDDDDDDECSCLACDPTGWSDVRDFDADF